MPVVAKPTVLQAVKELWASVPGLPALWLDAAPETTAYPRGVVTDFRERPTADSYADDTPTEAFAEFTVRLLAENDSDLAEDLALVVMDAFKPAALQLTFDAKARMFRGDRRVYQTDDRTTAGVPVYACEIDYSVTLSPDY